MSGFLYFKPDATKTVTAADVKAWGLGHAFTSDSVAGTVCNINTPTGGTGMVFADEKRLGEMTAVMQMEDQEWRKIPKSDCYVGYWKAAPPTPEDLIRPTYLPGYFVAMGDHEWVIPLTARFDETRKLIVTALPCYLECDESGNWNEGDVLDLHRHLWEIGQPFRDDVTARLLNGEPPRDFTNNELGNAAVGYLQANYVVGPGELTAMHGLQKGPEIQGAIMAANDIRTFAAWADEQKKSEVQRIADGSNIASGEAA
jgi:hypothetical protein